MVLLIVFAFLAGIVTVLSPCILPILPIILSSTIGGKSIGKARPVGVVLGFIASFTFFTLFLSSLVSVLRIPADSLRILSVIVIGVLGISFLIPQFQTMLERLFSKFAQFAPVGNQGTGFWSGVIIGLSVGLLWTPCVGPILASVIALAITGSVTATAFFITFAYALGTAIPMFAIMIGGQSLLKRVPWLLYNTGTIQKVFGVIMILTAFAIFNNYDRMFQTYILNTFPQYGSGLTKLEDTKQVNEQLDKLRDSKTPPKQSNGQPMFDLLPKGTKAPQLIQGGDWFNSKPLTLADLKGKVVVIDFWTYSCINCQRTLPYLKKWYADYKDKGLVIIGVHAPEFAFEKESKNVAKAITDFGIKYPVMQDNDFATWKAYDNHYWPAKFIIDKDGYIRYTHFGEGDYDETEKVIQELLQEAGAKGVTKQIKNPTYEIYADTPETYLGYERTAGLVSPEAIEPDTPTLFTAPKNIPSNRFAYTGIWNVMPQYANPQKGASLEYNFSAKEVFLVMKPKGGKRAKVTVTLDGKKQDLGADVKNGVVTVDSDRLYKLIMLPTAGRHLLRLDFEDGEAQLFAFTFG